MYLKKKLWTLAFVLALLKSRLDAFHGETDGDGTSGSREGNTLTFTSSIKFVMETHTHTHTHRAFSEGRIFSKEK